MQYCLLKRLKKIGAVQAGRSFEAALPMTGRLQVILKAVKADKD